MSIISEIESIQLKIKESLNKTLEIDSLDNLNEYISSEDFQAHFQKVEKTSWTPGYYNQLKEDLCKSEKKDNFTETSDLSKILKTLYAERFYTK